MNEAERIDIGELRQDASRYVEMAKAGRRIAVTDRGELVAYLVPAEQGGVVLEAASRLPDPVLRTLDAIHVATALQIREDVEVLVSDDQRMLAAAAAHGLPTASPA